MDSRNSDVPKSEFPVEHKQKLLDDQNNYNNNFLKLKHPDDSRMKSDPLNKNKIYSRSTIDAINHFKYSNFIICLIAIITLSVAIVGFLRRQDSRYTIFMIVVSTLLFTISFIYSGLIVLFDFDPGLMSNSSHRISLKLHHFLSASIFIALSIFIIFFTVGAVPKDQNPGHLTQDQLTSYNLIIRFLNSFSIMLILSLGYSLYSSTILLWRQPFRRSSGVSLLIIYFAQVFALILVFLNVFTDVSYSTNEAYSSYFQWSTTGMQCSAFLAFIWLVIGYFVARQDGSLHYISPFVHGYRFGLLLFAFIILFFTMVDLDYLFVRSIFQDPFLISLTTLNILIGFIFFILCLILMESLRLTTVPVPTHLRSQLIDIRNLSIAQRKILTAELNAASDFNHFGTMDGDALLHLMELYQSKAIPNARCYVLRFYTNSKNYEVIDPSATSEPSSPIVSTRSVVTFANQTASSLNLHKSAIEEEEIQIQEAEYDRLQGGRYRIFTDNDFKNNEVDDTFQETDINIGLELGTEDIENPENLDKSAPPVETETATASETSRSTATESNPLSDKAKDPLLPSASSPITNSAPQVVSDSSNDVAVNVDEATDAIQFEGTSVALVFITIVDQFDISVFAPRWFNGCIKKLAVRLCGIRSLFKLLVLRLMLVGFHWPFHSGIFLLRPNALAVHYKEKFTKQERISITASVLRSLSEWNLALPSSEQSSMTFVPTFEPDPSYDSFPAAHFHSMWLPPTNVVDLRQSRGMSWKQFQLSHIKKNNRRFYDRQLEAMGGRIAFNENWNLNLSQNYIKNWRTVARYRDQRDEPPVFFEPTPQFISNINFMPPLFRRLLTVEDNTGFMVGNSVSFIFPKAHYLTSDLHGLDHIRARPVRAYFVMLQQAVRWALEHDIKWLDFGPTTYEPKHDIGAKLVRMKCGYSVNSAIMSILFAIGVQSYIDGQNQSPIWSDESNYIDFSDMYSESAIKDDIRVDLDATPAGSASDSNSSGSISRRMQARLDKKARKKKARSEKSSRSGDSGRSTPAGTSTADNTQSEADDLGNGPDSNDPRPEQPRKDDDPDHDRSRETSNQSGVPDVL